MAPGRGQARNLRRLGAGDLGAMRAMNALFAQVFGAPGDYPADQPDDLYCTDWLANPYAVAIVAEAGEGLAGALAGFILPKFEQARSELFIYDLAVSEKHRRQGVASALIEETRRIAREAGCWMIFVQADILPEDAPARALYRKFAQEEITAHHFDIAP